MPATATPEARVLLVVDAPFRADDPDHLRALDAVAGREAHVLTAARAIDGERWIIDLTARAEAASERLDTWRDPVSRRARSTTLGIGDANVTAAISDARRALGDVEIVRTPPECRPAEPTTEGVRGLVARVVALRRSAWVS